MYMSEKNILKIDKLIQDLDNNDIPSNMGIASIVFNGKNTNSNMKLNVNSSQLLTLLAIVEKMKDDIHKQVLSTFKEENL